MAPMAGPDRLTVGGFLGRFAFALVVVGATYNPTAYSYYAWARTTGWEWHPPIVFVGVGLLIGWVNCLRPTLRSIGGVSLAPAQRVFRAPPSLLPQSGVFAPYSHTPRPSARPA